jgi:hypothetical protein
MSGRGMGYCSGDGAPGWGNRGPGGRSYGRGGWGGRGRGFGAGRGGGYRWRHWYYATGLPGWARGEVPPAPPSREEEIEMLKDEAKWLKEQLETINRQMKEIGG